MYNNKKHICTSQKVILNDGSFMFFSGIMWICETLQ